MCRRVLFLSCLLIALACSRSERDASAPSAPSAPAFKVALLTPGSIADGGWNQGAYEGLMRLKDELGADVAHVETKTPAQFEEEFRGFATRGYHLIFGHGFEYQGAAATVAAEFPETIFVTTSGNTVRPNLAPMVFELEQATYLCGVLAARMTESRTLGLVGGIDLPSIRSTFLAFRAGVDDTAPGIEVREVYLGNFDDVAAAREATLALLDEGADLLMHQANDAGRGVFQALAERAVEGKRVYGFGTNRNQNYMASNVVLGSAVLDVPAAFLRVARDVREKRFMGAPLRLGLREGIVKLELNDDLRDRIPPEVQGELTQLEARIRNGELVVPRGDF